ncbi:MAG: hypothetical protein QOD60_353 [Solirubrobacterales bacterium]|nr:hypothetical protein [Solirubrobacterales bacterium]
MLVAGSLVGLAACGGPQFSAGSFVKKANASGAGLALGPPLGTSQTGKKTYEVRLIVGAGAPKPSPGEENGLSGSLTVYDDQSAAGKGFTQCQAATSLLCYQAGNVTLVFEGSQPNVVQLRLAAALKKMAG